jgi:AcrR family transcriptional regulator
MNESTSRVLEAAEALFMESGYAAVKLKHIAAKLGVKESSIYYHFPGGKEELYVAVMTRSMAHHHAGVQNAITAAGEDWVGQLRHVAYWLLSQPPLDIVRLNKADLPAIHPSSALAITEAAYEALNLPVKKILERAEESGTARVVDADLVAGMFIGMMSMIDVVKSEWNPKTPTQMADLLLDLWLDGLRV